MAANDPHPALRANISLRGRALGRLSGTLDTLNSRDTEERRAALALAAASFESGDVPKPQAAGSANLLARTFFSYAVDGSSPARRVWEAAIRGLSVIGCCDTDNLGALREMLDAGDALGVRAVASLETKCYVPDSAAREFSYPGQCGFLRAMGLGFTAVPPLETEHGRFLAGLPEHAHIRHRNRIEKLNSVLSPVCIAYEEDVLPLAPAGNPAPEHIAAAYVRKAESLFPDREARAVFWSDVLGGSPADAEALIADLPAFGEAVWEKFRQFTAEERVPANYPAVADFFKAVAAAGAVPCVFWADGGTDGEADAGRFLDGALGWGARAVALLPDCVWNVPDREEKRARLGRLAELVAAARARALPLVAGSFLNRAGQKFVDSFDAPELAEYFRDFSDAAFWVYGHSVMERAAGRGLLSGWSRHAFGADRAAANAFFRDAGRAAAPSAASRLRIASAAGDGASPADILAALAAR